MSTSENETGSKNDQVGYKRPPRSTRFVSGTSGNPKGRPKRSSNSNEDITDELDRIVHVTEMEGGKVKKLKITARRVIQKQLVKKAMGGDLKAIGLLHKQTGKKLKAGYEGPVHVTLDLGDTKITDPIDQK